MELMWNGNEYQPQDVAPTSEKQTNKNETEK